MTKVKERIETNPAQRLFCMLRPVQSRIALIKSSPLIKMLVG